MRRALAAVVLAAGCRSVAVRDGAELSLAWEKNILTIRGPGLPAPVTVLYLEAYCRSGSTNRDWKETVIPHRTEKVEASPDGKVIRLRSRVEGGVEVDHEIRAGRGEVDFRVEAVNRGPAYVDAVWVQPCVELKGFTGATQESYVRQCFIFVNGELTYLPDTRRTEEAIYRGGQVYVPEGIDRRDVNPRPLSPDVPSNGLIGCFSADGNMLFATAWEPAQELFQGVRVCLHSDFRLGGLQPGETKRARGKIYLIANDVDRLLGRYLEDFPREGKN
jgi:hypothetical protein